MQKKEIAVQDSTGQAIAGASVLITKADGSAAAIFSGNGVGAMGSTLTTDAFGKAYFYAPDGRYTAIVSVAGKIVGREEDFLLEDPIDSPTVTAAELEAETGFELVNGKWFGNVVARVAVLASAVGSSLIGFIQLGVGAVARSIQDKLRDTVSAADFATLQDALNTGKVVELVQGGVYHITQTLVIPSGGGIIGKGTITFNSTDFPDTVKGITGTSIVIYALNVNDVTLRDFKMVGTCGQNSWIYPIALRGVQKADVWGIDIYGLNAGSMVLVDSSFDWKVQNCFFHDGTLDRNISGGQLTAVEVDDFRIGGVGSERFDISHNNFKDLGWTPAFLAGYGPQTDAVNIKIGAKHYTVAFNTMDGVGEGVDSFGDDGKIIGNTIRNALGYGIKLIHGASRNLIALNIIKRSGLGGIVIAGSDSASQNTDRNTVEANVISEAGYDPGNYWSQPTYGIGINNDGATYKATNTLVRGNRVLSSPNADGAFQSATAGAGNVYTEDNYSDGTAAAEYLGAGATIYKRGQFGGVAAPNRVATFDQFGVLTLRYDDNGATTMLQYGNYALSGVGQGASIAWQYGIGGVFSATAARMRVLSTDSWAASGNRSVEWSLDLIQGGALGAALKYSPASGLKVGTASAVVAFPNGIIKAQPFTVATLPSASENQWGIIAVTDGAANKRLAISDGTNWRWPDGAIVS